MSHPSKELPEATLDALIVDERRRVIEPLTEWQSLVQQLQKEGLVRPPADTVPPSSYQMSSPRASSISAGTVQRTGQPTESLPQRRFTLGHWAVRAVACVALVGAGIFIGRTGWPATAQPSAPVAVNNDAPTSTQAASEMPPAELATSEYQSPEDALRAIKRAQIEYVMATAFLASHDQTGQPVMRLARLRERLAALDAVVAAAQNAVRESPNDPVLTQYYMSSSGARNATLQLLNQNLPQGARLAGY